MLTTEAKGKEKDQVVRLALPPHTWLWKWVSREVECVLEFLLATICCPTPDASVQVLARWVPDWTPEMALKVHMASGPTDKAECYSVLWDDSSAQWATVCVGTPGEWVWKWRKVLCRKTHSTLSKAWIYCWTTARPYTETDLWLILYNKQPREQTYSLQ